MVWGTMPASGVSELHVLPPNQTERAKYNQENIQSLILPDGKNKTSDTGTSYRKKIYENMLDLTLFLDGAPAHKATETLNRL